MNIRIDPKSNEIYVSAGEIAFFARTKSESVQRRNLFISTDAEEIPQGGKDLFLAVTSGEIAFTVTGTMSGRTFAGCHTSVDLHGTGKGGDFFF